MGGSALTKVETRRYEKEEFNTISNYVLTLLRQNGHDAVSLLHYRNKKSFGDLDVLVRWDKAKDDCMFNLMSLFSPKDWKINGNVLSLNVNDFQVDFIVTPSVEFPTSYHYFSYNDLGNLMGRIARQVFGVQYGHKGLIAPVKGASGAQLGSVLISTDNKKIFEFLGFDWRRYMQGFDNLEDIFQYVASSRYFRPEYFDYTSLNHINRTRNRKRPNYNLFLSFVHDNGLKGSAESPNYTVDSFFPEVNFVEQKNNLIWFARRYKEAKLRILSIIRMENSYHSFVAEKSKKFKVKFPNPSDFVSKVESMSNEDILKFIYAN